MTWSIQGCSGTVASAMTRNINGDGVVGCPCGGDGHMKLREAFGLGPSLNAHLLVRLGVASPTHNRADGLEVEKKKLEFLPFLEVFQAPSLDDEPLLRP